MLQVASLFRYTSPKVVNISKAATLIAQFKKAGKTAGLCHGGYDLLHPGHITHFESAKKACDILFVSVTSDRFVAGRKGFGRPIFTDKLRAYMIAAIALVEYVVVTDFKSGVDVINLLKPSYYIKGPDFIGKQTPGIIAEREAIAKAGGKMLYTNDPKLATTQIIDYIKNHIIDDAILIIIDRDGTLIANNDFFGRNAHWKKDLTVNKQVASFLYYLQVKYHTTKIVASNQAGVARGFFSTKTVEDINAAVSDELKKYNVTIDNWQYCPYVDSAYAKAHPEYTMKKILIQEKTKRKPSPDMVIDGLKALNVNLKNFKTVLVVGDRQEDRELAANIGGKFLDVKGKTYDQLLEEFNTLVNLS